ncbi:hypothetical protein ACFX1S_026710 [Malus domestica]
MQCDVNVRFREVASFFGYLLNLSLIKKEKGRRRRSGRRERGRDKTEPPGAKNYPRGPLGFKTSSLPSKTLNPTLPGREGGGGHELLRESASTVAGVHPSPSWWHLWNVT